MLGCLRVVQLLPILPIILKSAAPINIKSIKSLYYKLFIDIAILCKCEKKKSWKKFKYNICFETKDCVNSMLNSYIISRYLHYT